MHNNLANPASVLEYRGVCMRCYLLLIFILAAIVLSFSHLNLNLWSLFLVDNLVEVGRYTSRFFPPEASFVFLKKIASALIETFAISLIATTLAGIAGFIASVPASGRFGSIFKFIFRGILNFLRSVPELVWATLMVLCVGLGAFAGTLALMLHTTGVLGRMYAETLENQPSNSYKALEYQGAGTVSAFLYGTIAEVYTQLLSYTLYRWEMNIRMAAILGLVGAGGLGQMLFYELSLFHEKQASTVILAMLALVIAVDIISARFRYKQDNK